MTSLLPPNTTPLERRMEVATSELERAQAPLETLWDAKRMPENMLPWLAWAVGVDQWSRRWPESTRRDAIEQAIPIRRLRGTVWAVRRALEVQGYSDVEILEHAEQNQKWADAGGLSLDGSWTLDGRSLLVEDGPRVVTTHWAQYALAFNIADAPFTADDQRRLRDRVEAAAPLRSELIALIYRYAATFSSRITVSPVRRRVHLDFTGCQGAQVHQARQLTGCWSLSDEYEPRLLDGTDRLDGNWFLTGQRPVGPSLNEGWGTASLRVRMSFTSCMHAESDNDWTLDETHVDRLDGSWGLNETLDGHRTLDGSWSLDIAMLDRVTRPTLNGARVLGDKQVISSIGTTAYAVVRDRRLRTEIRL